MRYPAQDLKKSKGDAARKLQTEQSEAVDVVDGPVSSGKRWKVGEKCRALYASNSEIYEGIICF